MSEFPRHKRPDGYPPNADAMTVALWEYHDEYVAYENICPTDTKEYFNFMEDLIKKYRFLPNSVWLRGDQAHAGVIEAYTAIKLAKVKKVEKWILNDQLSINQTSFAIFTIKSLGVTDEYIDELYVKREKLRLDKEKLKLIANTKISPIVHTISVGFE